MKKWGLFFCIKQPVHYWMCGLMVKQGGKEENYEKYFFLILLIIVFINNESLAKEKKFKYQFPKVNKILIPPMFKCKSIVYSYVGVTQNWKANKKEITSEIGDGTDELSIQIEGDALYLMTAASFRVRFSRPAKYNIIKNTDKKIIAVYFDMTESSIDIFAINKDTGLAVWSRTSSCNILYWDNPSTDWNYLLCK